MWLEREEGGQNLLHVIPVIRVVGLDDERSAGSEGLMDISEEPRGEHPLAGLAVIVVRLGMIKVDLGRGARGHVRCQECLSILDREPS